MKQNELFAEALGTMLLVLLLCGSAVMAGPQIGVLGVSLCAGLTLMCLIYALGPISGCHINPAVTLCMLLIRKIDVAKAVQYIAAQLVGGVLGGYLLYYIASGGPDFSLSDGFAVNGYDMFSPGRFGLIPALLTETIATAVLLIAVMSTTARQFPASMSGLMIGGTLTALHLFSMPVTNTSLNIARSLGCAVIVGPQALQQLWVFAVAQGIAVLIAVTTHCVLLKGEHCSEK